MPFGWTPARRRGVEILDDPATPRDVRQRAMADIARSNALLGGTRAVLAALDDVLPRVPRLPRDATLLDVGTGLGDIPERAAERARHRGVALTTIGLDVSESILASARAKTSATVVGDALRLPIADASADVVTCSQLLHHFTDVDARAVIAEVHRVARVAVIIADLRRSRVAAAAFALAGSALRFHAVTRHDGVASVYRGFTAAELGALVVDATGVTPRLRRDAFWRLSATWFKPSRP